MQVEREIVFPASPAEVWEALTEAEREVLTKQLLGLLRETFGTRVHVDAAASETAFATASAGASKG